MDRNICENGTVLYTSENNYCRYAWHWKIQESDEYENNYGPDTAMTNLYNGTKGWVNVPDMIMNYEDENNKTDNTKGYIGITTDINTKVTTITGKRNKTSQYQTFGNTTEPLKARLPREDEVTSQDAGCHVLSSDAYYGTCPVWLVENLKYQNVSSYAGSGNTDKYNEINSNNGITNIYGYWLLSSKSGRAYDAFSVTNGGCVSDYLTAYGSEFGVRPVITVPISDLSN